MLDIVESYNYFQFQGKILNQTWENGKKTNFGPGFGSFWCKVGPPIFFSWIVPLLDVIHCCKLSQHAISKLMNQTWKNGKKTIFRHDFVPFDPNLSPKPFFIDLPLLEVRHYCKLSLYAISRKTNEPNLRKWQKT